MKAYLLSVVLEKIDITTNTKIRDTISYNGKLVKVPSYPESSTTHKEIHIYRNFISNNIKELKRTEKDLKKRYSYVESEIKTLELNDSAEEV